LWNQQDLKKLIAYCTVQEMNLIYSCFILGDTYLSYIGFLFCFTHALLSTLFFFLVDCVYIRYRTRSLTKVLGVFKLNPKLAWIIFISCMIFSGVPGSLKFICELFIFMAYFEISRILFFISIFFVNYIGIIGFFRCWFSVIFGDRINTLSKSYLRPKADLTRKEFNIFFFCVFLLIFSTFLLNWIQ
jgi:formate hydrogenlyase subunit 3/multisubunit Na+/H+ antiporter MnhD subunit